MQLTFGNMALELNIFHLSNMHKLMEDDKRGADEVCSICQNAGKSKAPKLQADLVNQDEIVDWELVAQSPLQIHWLAQNHPVRRKSTRRN